MKRLAEILTRQGEIRSALEAFHAKDELTEDEQRDADELMVEYDQLEEERKPLAERAERIEVIKNHAKDPKRVHSGSAPDALNEDPLGDPDSVETRHGFSNPWDFDAVRLGQFGSQEEAASELRARALTAVEKTPGMTARAKEKVTKLLEAAPEDEYVHTGKLSRHILAVSSPEYIKAFGRALRTLYRTGTADPTAVATLNRAMSLTDAAGGHAVPLPIDPTLILDDDGSVNPFRQISTTRTVTTDELKTVSSDHPNFSFDAEALEVSDDATTYGQITITVRKAQGLLPYSIEIGQDYPNFTQDMAELMARGRDDLEATVFATGVAASNQPIGIVTALVGGSSEVVSNTADTFALSDVYDLEEELPARFRARASWVANKRIYQAMREAGGANLDDFWANLGQGQPRQVLGYPAYEADQMDGTIEALAENRVLVFGDFSNYWIVDRAGFSVELVPHMLALANNRPSGQRALYCWWRVGADSTRDRAFRILNVT